MKKEIIIKELGVIKKYYDVIERILGLLATMEEAIFYVQNQLVELRYEEAFVLLQDMMDGVTSIESAIAPMESELPNNEINSLLVTLKEKLAGALNSYENNKVSILENQVLEETLPNFEKWKEEVEKILRPYVVS